MVGLTYVIGFNVTVACAFARVGGIVVAAARSVLIRRRFATVAIGWREAVTLLEPAALAATTYALLVDRRSPDGITWPSAVAAISGAVVAAAGLAVIVWSLLSWRQLFVGHAVLEDHQLVTGGSYGRVRHPVYLGALLIWAGLSITFLSPIAGAITIGYVLPAYVLYMRAEEEMMLSWFGDVYERYRRDVPMLIPRRRG